jgi:hypothetical protein
MMRQIRPDEVEQEVTQRDQFDTDMVGLAETLVREAHQNSVDGGSSVADGPVRTRIMFTRAHADDAAFWEQLLNPLRPHLRAAGMETPDIDFTRPPLLVIEDFGTTGLLGDVDRKDNRNFSDFWRRTGRSHKHGQQGGRWGLGKLVYSSASRIRTFFAETIRDDDPSARPYLMGQTVLKHHTIGGSDYAPHGFFAVSGEDRLQLPSSDQAFIARFRSATGISRTNEPGLSIVIPFPQLDLDTTEMLPHVVRNWFFPILTGQLVVEVGNSIIDQASFPNLAREYGGPAFESGTLVAFITALEEAAQQPPLYTAVHGWATRGIEESLGADHLEELRETFVGGGLVSVRAPLTLRPKSGGVRETHIDLYLQSHGDISRADALYVRGALTVPGEARRFRGRSCYGALIAKEPSVAEFLGDAEGPAHTSWSGSAEKVKENWKNPGERLKEIRLALNYFYNAVAQPADREDKDALINIFSVRDKGSNGQRNRGPVVKPPKVPPIPRSLSQYRIVPHRGGLAIRSTPDTQPPLQLRVRLAYDVVTGDPLKKYDPLDFNLVTSPGLAVEATGAVASISAPNELQLEVHASTFALNVDGFDVNRDVFVRVDRQS